jgi:hypothetical protein
MLMAGLALCARLAACGETGEPSTPAVGGGAEGPMAEAPSPTPQDEALAGATEDLADAGADAAEAEAPPVLVAPTPPHLPTAAPSGFAILAETLGEGACPIPGADAASLIRSVTRQVRACCEAHLARRRSEPGHAVLTLHLGAGVATEVALHEHDLGEHFEQCVSRLVGRWPEDALSGDCSGPVPAAVLYACAPEPEAAPDGGAP